MFVCVCQISSIRQVEPVGSCPFMFAVTLSNVYAKCNARLCTNCANGTIQSQSIHSLTHQFAFVSLSPNAIRRIIPASTSM